MLTNASVRTPKILQKAPQDPPVYALFEKCAAAVSFGRRGAATMPIYTKVYFTTVGQSDKVYKIWPKLIQINFRRNDGLSFA